jgi:alpha/beta superfamily hydrolase
MRGMSDNTLVDAPDGFPDDGSGFALAGPAGALEVSTDIPGTGHARQGTAVICHPHPLEGGTMHNKVVTMLERALRESGLATVRFNFRGVGASEGEFDEGRGEGEDLAAVSQWVRRVHPDDALWLAGFSFGSYVALASAARLDAAALITVAPPVGRSYSFDNIELPKCPWLLIQGEADEIVDAQAVFDWVDTLERPPSVVRMPETSHFFHRRLLDLRGAIKNAVRTWLPPERGA